MACYRDRFTFYNLFCVQGESINLLNMCIKWAAYRSILRLLMER
jgi:hypothetical protein